MYHLAPRPVDKIQEDTNSRGNTSAAVWWEPPKIGGVTGYRLLITSRTMAVGDFPIPGSNFNQQNITVKNTTTRYTFYQLTPASSYQVSIWALYHGAESEVERYTTVYTSMYAIGYRSHCRCYRLCIQTATVWIHLHTTQCVFRILNIAGKTSTKRFIAIKL